jgi:hypothetical protein
VDFEAAGNDVIEIDASSFGCGLTAGEAIAPILEIRGSNLALQDDTRFVFRNSDATLWFDSNGNDTGGRTLIADLQQSAAVTFGSDDILLI